MIMQEKIKVMKKQNPNSSNSFLFCKSYINSKIPTDYPQNPWGFITVPIPIPMGIPMGITIPTAALQCRLRFTCDYINMVWLTV